MQPQLEPAADGSSHGLRQLDERKEPPPLSNQPSMIPGILKRTASGRELAAGADDISSTITLRSSRVAAKTDHGEPQITFGPVSSHSIPRHPEVFASPPAAHARALPPHDPPPLRARASICTTGRPGGNPLPLANADARARGSGEAAILLGPARAEPIDRSRGH
ncbi:hypothetical protein T492DRAFT_953184 [Pavlovales sp. CCMP2436]|nr:hypothetical protein T492DRAFT_953184 [Pavlovales sp. CCMP2436]